MTIVSRSMLSHTSNLETSMLVSLARDWAESRYLKYRRGMFHNDSIYEVQKATEKDVSRDMTQPTK